MKVTDLTLPQLALIGGTRGMLGLGIGLLVAKALSDGHRKEIGWGLVAVGALSTIPLALMVFRHRERAPQD